MSKHHGTCGADTEKGWAGGEARGLSVALTGRVSPRGNACQAPCSTCGCPIAVTGGPAAAARAPRSRLYTPSAPPPPSCGGGRTPPEGSPCMPCHSCMPFRDDSCNYNNTYWGGSEGRHQGVTRQDHQSAAAGRAGCALGSAPRAGGWRQGRGLGAGRSIAFALGQRKRMSPRGQEGGLGRVRRWRAFACAPQRAGAAGRRCRVRSLRGRKRLARHV